MIKIDPASLLFMNGLLSLVFATVLLLSRIGLGSAAAGVGTWVCGDLAMGVARMLIVYELLHPGFAGHSALGYPTYNGPLVIGGIVTHVYAIALMWKPSITIRQALAGSFGAGLSYLLVALLLPSPFARVITLDALIGVSSLLSLLACWPLRRFWGARVIGVLMALAVCVLSAQTFGALFGLRTDTVMPGMHGDKGGMQLFTELIVTSFVTAAYTMLVQERLRERIERLVVTDMLTGVLNRHGLMAPLQRELAMAQRSGRPLAVVLFDLDHFKRVNDQHGHGVGDDVLSGFATLVSTLTRSTDLFGRWGGEEFLLVLPDTGAAGALMVAERIRTRVADAPVAVGAPRITISGGVASAVEVHGTVDALLKMLELADKRLYLAKNDRNQVIGAPPGDEAEPRGPANHGAGNAVNLREPAEQLSSAS